METEPEKKKSGRAKTLRIVLITVLATLAVLFLIFMLLPDGEDESSEKQSSKKAAAIEEDADEDPEEEDPVENPKKDPKKGPKERPEKGTTNDLLSGLGTRKAHSVKAASNSATIMVYMNGSDLETRAGAATEDISEMLSSGIGENVNVIIQTMGTREWQDYDISGRTAQTWKIEDGELVLIRDNLGQLSCTAADTLSEFVGFCEENYPAQRYFIIFWDHGGGPVYGFGYDEWKEEKIGLTIAEMSQAFSEHPDVHFDFIGMDCCIMANLETCYALMPYCRYAILSEDFESGLGWSYDKWMNKLEDNPQISTPLLGKFIVDSIIAENEGNPEGGSTCLSMINQSTIRNLLAAWMQYAYKNEEALMGSNYSRMHKAQGRSVDFSELWDDDYSDVTLSDYYITDILALVENIDSDSTEARELISTLKAAVAYNGHTSDKNELTGMSVSLPYGDPYFYSQLRKVYGELDFDEEYLDWLEGFVSDSDYDDYYDYDEFSEDWCGWEDYESEYGCNGSNGSCEYGYDYDSGDYYGDDEDEWIYDYEEDLWYLYEDDILFLYDEDSDTLFCYDEEEDEFYYYDEEDDDWYPIE